jgi:hypothetical protein
LKIAKKMTEEKEGKKESMYRANPVSEENKWEGLKAVS